LPDGRSGKCYDTVDKVWHHLHFFQHRCFLHCRQIKDSDEAKLHLTFWCELAMESGIQPFIKFVNTLKVHWSGIVNYFDTKLTNGILEGINSKIQLAKRRARGFRNMVVSQMSCLTVVTTLIIKQLICKNNTFATLPEILTILSI